MQFELFNGKDGMLMVAIVSNDHAFSLVMSYEQYEDMFFNIQHELGRLENNGRMQKGKIH